MHKKRTLHAHVQNIYHDASSGGTRSLRAPCTRSPRAPSLLPFSPRHSRLSTTGGPDSVRMAHGGNQLVAAGGVSRERVPTRTARV